MFDDVVITGANGEENIISVEYNLEDSKIILFKRKDGIEVVEEDFKPYIICSDTILESIECTYELKTLDGNAALNSILFVENWEQWVALKKEIAAVIKQKFNNNMFLYNAVSDPVHQYLMITGKTYFKGMQFSDVYRMQVDIECITEDEYEFCNAGRAGDEIVAIAVSDSKGWRDVLHGGTEKEILVRFIVILKEMDPDVIEGHNIFNFDLPYLSKRCKRHKLKFDIGRLGKEPVFRGSQLRMAERSISYTRCDIYGRSVIDTMFLAQYYDINHRVLDSYGLKAVAKHFNIAPADRTYIEGGNITETFKTNPDELMKYALDDIIETERLATLLSQSTFHQATILPYSYQNVSVRGNATKIDALLIREYLRNKHSIPMPGESKPFEGAYADMFEEGVLENVYHCDVRSLYPSLMLVNDIKPASDDLGVFVTMLDKLRSFRFAAKDALKAAETEADKHYYDALQSTFKILINSFYGYLGFSMGHFCDFEKAGEVTSRGRKLLKEMITWLEESDCKPIEIDTDGIYFTAGKKLSEEEIQNISWYFQKKLPAGIAVEFDGSYQSMYSYKVKNYALLTFDDEVIIKGGALKSRGLEKFQREFLVSMIRKKLEFKDDEIPALKREIEEHIKSGEIPIESLAKRTSLTSNPAKYKEKVEAGGRSRSAVYEIALQSGKKYRSGDQLSYYITGTTKKVRAFEAAKNITDWDPENPDYNKLYYIDKLDALYKKFYDGPDDSDQAAGQMTFGF
jgi:DNA polymerase elongation subunit (family B)